MSPTRKIANMDAKRVCLHQDHNPPSHQVFQPGVYEHTCSGCGNKIVFTVYPRFC